MKNELSENNETIKKLKKENDEMKAKNLNYEANIQLSSKAEQMRYQSMKNSYIKAIEIIQHYLCDSKIALDQNKKAIPFMLNSFFISLKDQIAEISRNGNEKIKELKTLAFDKDNRMREKIDTLQLMLEKSKNEFEDLKRTCIGELKAFLIIQSGNYKTLELNASNYSKYSMEHITQLVDIIRSVIAKYKTEKSKNIKCGTDIKALIGSNKLEALKNLINVIRQTLAVQNNNITEVTTKIVRYCNAENENYKESIIKMRGNVENLRESLQQTKNELKQIIIISAQSIENVSSKKIEEYNQKLTQLTNIIKNIIVKHLSEKEKSTFLCKLIKGSFAPECKKTLNDVKQILLIQNEHFNATIPKMLEILHKQKEKLKILENAKEKTEQNNKQLIGENKGFKKNIRDLENLISSQKLDLGNEKRKLAELEEKLISEKLDKENVYKSKDEEKIAIQQHINKKDVEIEQLKAKVFSLKKIANQIRQSVEIAKEQNIENAKEASKFLIIFNGSYLENFKEILTKEIQKKVNELKMKDLNEINRIKKENEKIAIKYQEEIKIHKNNELERIKECNNRIEEIKRKSKLNLEDQLKSQDNENKKEIQKLKAGLSGLNKQIESNKKYMNEITRILAESKKQFSESTSTLLEFVKSKALVLKVKQSKLQKVLEDQTHKVKLIGEGIETLKTKMGNIMDQKEKNITSLISGLTQKFIERTHNILEKCTTSVCTLRNENSNLKFKIERKEEELNIVRTQRKIGLKDVKERIQNTNLAIKQKENEIKSILKEHTSSLVETKLQIIRTSCKIIKELNSKIFTLQSNLYNANAEHSKDKKLFEEEKAKLKSLLKDSEDQLNQQKQENEEKIRKLKEMNDKQMGQLKLKITKFGRLKEKIEYIKEEFEANQKEIGTMISKTNLLPERKEIIDKIFNNQNKQQQIRSELMSLNKNLISERQAFTLETAELKEIIQNYEALIKEKDKIISNKEHAVNKLKIHLKAIILQTKNYLKNCQGCLVVFETSLKSLFADYIEKYKKLIESRSAKIKLYSETTKAKILKMSKDYTDLKNKVKIKNEENEKTANALAQIKASVSSWIIQNAENMSTIFVKSFTDAFTKINNVEKR